MDVDKSTVCTPENDIGYLIWQLSKFWQRGKTKTTGEFGITGSQLEVLAAIRRFQNDVEITQITLSQVTSIDPMTMSTILRNLEKKQLITRRESKTDTRARIVDLTDAGHELLEKAFIRVQELHKIIFRRIDKDVFRSQLKILLEELNNLENQINI